MSQYFDKRHRIHISISGV